MHSFQLLHVGDSFDFEELDAEDVDRLRHYVENNVAVTWNNDGKIGRVPAAVLKNAFSIWDQWNKAPARWKNRPRNTGCIWWEQVVVLNP